VINELREKLHGLRGRFARSAESAYKDRDEADSHSNAESFAAGEAHAYGVAADAVREEQEPGDRSG